MNNEKIVATYRDFLLKYYDAAFGERKLTDAQKLDYMLEKSWFEYPSARLLLHFDQQMPDQILSDTQDILFNAKRRHLLSHPFALACIELNRAAFEELISE